MGNCSKCNVKSERTTSLPADTSLRNYFSSRPVRKSSEAASARVTKRSPSTSERVDLLKALSLHSIFCGVPESDQNLIIDNMKHYSLGAKQTVISQGSPGSNFFVIAKGKVEVLVNGAVKCTLPRRTGFGEIALMHDTERMATIRTIDEVELWGIHRDTFKRILKSINQKNHSENIMFLQSIPLFQGLRTHENEAIVNAMVAQEFMDQQVIIREGDPGYHLFIIKEGEVKCIKEGRCVRVMGKGDLFGEQALIYNTLRTATVIASGPVKVLSIKCDKISDIFGEQVYLLIYRNSLRMTMERSPNFQPLTKLQIDSLIDRMKIVKVLAGSTLKLSDLEIKFLVKGSLQSEEITVSELSYLDDIFGKGKEIKALQNSEIAEITYEDIERQLGGQIHEIHILNEAISVLKKLKIFQSISQKVVERLAGVLKLQEFKKNDIIFEEHEPGTAFYIIKEGEVDIIKDNVKLRTLDKNCCFGERAIIFNEKRTATVRAKSDTKLWLLSRDHFLSIVEERIRDQVYKKVQLQNDRINLEDLKFVKQIGNGIALTIYPKTECLYAIRRLSLDSNSERIERENRLFLKLDHPFIVKLVKVVREGTNAYFIMEYINGVPLESLPVLDNDQARFYAACLLLIGEYLKDKKIYHRNLNPQEFMIDKNSYPKLINLKTATKHRTNTLVSLPHYTSPEVTQGENYSFESDLWSIGVMIYELMTKTLPFGNDLDDPIRIYESIVHSKLEFNSRLHDNVPARSFLEILLSKNPVLRKNYEELKYNSWLSSICWDDLLTERFKPPFNVPRNSTNRMINCALRKSKTLLQVLN